MQLKPSCKTRWTSYGKRIMQLKPYVKRDEHLVIRSSWYVDI